MPAEIRQVYFLSNGTAITAETLGHSLLAQFPSLQFKTRTIPFIDSVEKALAVIQEIDLEVGASTGLPIVISTMADPELKKIIQQSQALVLDPLSDFLPRLEKILDTPSVQVSWSHRIANPSLYESRIDAIDFSLIHDDGGKTRNYNENRYYSDWRIENRQNTQLSLPRFAVRLEGRELPDYRGGYGVRATACTYTPIFRSAVRINHRPHSPVQDSPGAPPQ